MKQHLLRLFTLFFWVYFTAADPLLTKRQGMYALRPAGTSLLIDTDIFSMQLLLQPPVQAKTTAFQYVHLQ